MTRNLTLNKSFQISFLAFVASVSFLSSVAYGGPREAVLSVYQRLSGIPLVDQAQVDRMVTEWSSGNRQAVAKLATASESFVNVTAVVFGTPITDRDHSPHASLNDSLATIVGIIRDNLDARLMLTGDFRYEGDRSLYTVTRGNNTAAAPTAYSIANNTHYQELQDSNVNLNRVLIQVQQTFPEIAGIITTRGWMLAHADAGTNRRMIAEMINCFLGLKMEEVANNTLSHAFIRRDVDRAPGGDTSLFLGTCSGCHAGMDAMAGAVAKVSFVNGSPVHANANPPAGEFDTNGIAVKFNRNGQFFPSGYYTTSNSWTNLWKNSPSMRFSAASPDSGMGLESLAGIFAESEAFGENLVKRVFKTVCLRDTQPDEASLVRFLADGLRKNGYKLRELFESVALRPECSLIN